LQISSYSKVWALGHRETEHLFDGPVVVQEKVDGSQFSFGNIGGNLCCRSKGQNIGPDGHEPGMFSGAVKTADMIFRTGTLEPGTVVRGECLNKPKHNSITYGRIPVGGIAIFDVELEGLRYQTPETTKYYADKWSMEVVPTLFEGEISRNGIQGRIDEWLKLESFLGNHTIEGVVIKNYAKYDSFLKPLMGKFVSEAFKEMNQANWKQQSHGSGLDRIISSFNQEVIWGKSIQHLRDEGLLQGEPRDIGLLIKEIKTDFNTEHGDTVKAALVKEFYEDIERAILKGFPEWYKRKLVENLETSSSENEHE
jgi:hypothetical protein